MSESLSARVFASLFILSSFMRHKELLIFLTNSLASELMKAVISDPPAVCLESLITQV